MINSTDILIPAGRWDEEVFETAKLKSSLRRIIEAKSALYTGGDELKLIEEAVRAYNPNNPDGKCQCGGKTKLQFQDREMTVFVTSEPTVVNVRNAPVFVCESCGEEYYLLSVDVFLEREIEEEILKHLRSRKEPPVVFDFIDDFLNAV